MRLSQDARSRADISPRIAATLQGAYLRGTYPGFVGFYRACAPKAAAAIRGELSARDLASWLNRKHAEVSRSALDRSYA